MADEILHSRSVRWLSFLPRELCDCEQTVEKCGSSDDGGDSRVCEMPAARSIKIVEGAADADEQS